MYSTTNPVALVGGGLGGGLAYTGTNSVWLAIAAFTLIGTGLALLRIVPKLRFRRH